MTTSTLNVTINLLPLPGFCIKSKLLQPGILNVASTHESIQRPVPIPEGLKVFVNIAWSKDVPPPLDDVEKTLEFAVHNPQTAREIERNDAVSVFASEGRLDTDKAGKPALVFDCIYNSSFKHHALKDAEVRNFLVERALQEIEAQNSISLSRTLSTPNIASKGVLEQRVVSVPAALFPPGHHYHPSRDKPPPKKLIEEVITSHSNSTVETPSWTWSQEGGEIHITIRVANLTLATVSSATLDLEPRRIMLHIPNLYALDVDLELSDAELRREMLRVGASPKETENVLMLKRARDLDVDRARAEWRVNKRCLVIVA